MLKTLIRDISAISITALIGLAQVPTPEMNKILTAAAQSLAEMTFDSAAPVTVHGRVAILVWPEGTSGMIVVEAEGSGDKYAFSTAKVPVMARQGFSRFTMQPGADVVVTGVRAKDDAKIGPGFKAARADIVTKSDGNRVFDRSRLEKQ